jgi:Protein of unknown function DUF262
LPGVAIRADHAPLTALENLVGCSNASSSQRHPSRTLGSVTVEVDTQQLTAARYKIEDLLRFVQQGRIRIPRFQRPLRWTGTDVERLFDSIYRGFPIGTLLFWVKEAEKERVHLGPVVVDAPALSEASWVVDGQQRITSLAACLLPSVASDVDSRFEISFDLERENFGPTRPVDPDSRIPIRSAYDLQHVLAWLKERDLDPRLQERAFKLADRLRNYEIAAYQVSTADEAALQVIFDRTNTFGKSMTKAEVFRALNTSSTKPRADIGTLDDDIASLGFGTLSGNTLLYALLAARGPDVLREFRSEFESAGDQMQALADTKLAVERVARFLVQRADVPHFGLVPYQHQTVGLVRFFALHPEPEPHILVLLRRWFWQAAEVGPIARLGNTGTLRATTGAIHEGDSYTSVKGLLELSDTAGPAFEIGNYRWTSASTRTAVCALAHLSPVDLADGERIDVTRVVDLLGREALGPIVDQRRSGGLRKSIANRMFFTPSDRISESELADLIISAPDERLRSHCLPAGSVRHLLAGEDHSFLATRAEAMRELVSSFLAVRAERTVAVRRPIAEYVDDDD